jgi:nitroreductase
MEVERMSESVSAALAERRAIRKYLPQPISDDLVREILAEARWAPSATNTQSTYVYVLSGEPFQQFKSDFREYARSEAPTAPDLGSSPPLPAFLQARQDELFQTRASFIAEEEAKMGLPLQVPPLPPMVAAAEVYGAPLLMVLAIPNDIGAPIGCFDAGLLAQSIALAAHARGLGTCISGSLVRYPDLLRKVIPSTEDKTFVVSIALGRPDWEAPINRFPRTRIDVDEFTTFVR